MIVSFYAAILGWFYAYLSIRVIRTRRELRIGLGDGGNEAMRRAVAVHANFAEYVPISLILIGLVEVRESPSWLVHALAICLLIGRGVHAYGVSQQPENFKFRVIGMAMTFTSLMISSAYLVFAYFRALIA